jgi:hypothetical protein
MMYEALLDYKDGIIDGLRDRISALELYVAELEEEVLIRDEA